MGIRIRSGKPVWAGIVATLVFAATISAYSANEPPAPIVPLSMGPVDYLGSLSTPADAKGRPSAFRRFVNKTLGLDDDHRRMNQPHGVAVATDGRVLVADTRGQVVHVFDRERRQYKQLRAPESDPFLSPIAVALDRQGRIYVTDSGRSRIFVFRPDGKFLRTLGALGKNESIFKRCTGLAIDNQRDILYVVDTVAMRIVALDLDGKVLGRIGHPGAGPAEFNYPTHISVAADGTLWVVDSLNFRVQHLDTAGNILDVFGGQGDHPGEFDKPKGIALDSQGRVFVVEGRFDRVQAYDPEGRMLFTFGSTGRAPGEFFLPAGISLDKEGRIYVADGQNGRVEIFRMAGGSKGVR